MPAEIARKIGGLAVTTDVAVEREMQALVGEVLRRFGAIDLFCSNAGVALGGGFGEAGGPFASEDCLANFLRHQRDGPCVRGARGAAL